MAPQIPFTPPVVLSPEAFYTAIGGVIGKNRIYELLHSGSIRHVRVGSRFLILASEVHDFFHRAATPLQGEERA